MIFSFSDEHGELRDGLRRFLASKSASADVRRLMDTAEGYDPKVWQQLAQQLGVTGLTIPEKFGGLGYGAVEQAIVLEEMGRALLCAPYFGTAVLAVQALLASGDAAAQEQHLPGIAEGTTIATLAVPEDDGRWDTAAMTTRATRDASDGTATGTGTGDGAGSDGSASSWRLDGRKSFVLDGHTAGLIIVAAQADGGPSLFAVAGDADGLTREPLETLDRTRKLARLDLASVPAQLIGTEGGAGATVRRTLQFAAAALAAEQVGGAQRCLDMSVEYAKLRMQFGRPIGGFQAIKHMCADMLLEVESARSAAYYAAWAAAEDSDELPLVSSLAKAYCSEAYFQAAADNIQIHGGIGFTWEHDAHLYYRRAKSSELMLGTPSEHREIAATYLIDQPAATADAG